MGKVQLFILAIVIVCAAAAYLVAVSKGGDGFQGDDTPEWMLREHTMY